MEIQEKLNEVYRPLVEPELVFGRLQPWNDAESVLKELNGPFLIAANEDYESSSPKVVIVGQENNGWLPYSYADFLNGKTIDDPLALYDDFLRKWPYNSTFFQYFADIRKAIHNSASQKSSRSVLWSNLFKLNHNGKHTLSSPHCQKMLALQEGVFRNELEALKPDAVIFLTGPRYDLVIRQFFGDETRFIALEGHSDRQAAQVVAPGLPQLTFRTYHPGFINRNKVARWGWYESILQRILD